MKKSKKYFFAVLVFLLFAACTAPRTVIQEGRSTPKGKARGGLVQSYNISTQTVSSVFGLESEINGLVGQDSLVFSDSLNDYSEALVAYSLDPLSMGSDLWLRFGLTDNIDLGYRYASGVHVFGAGWQFLESAGTNASVGLEYSSQEWEFPSYTGLDKLQGWLGYKFTRKDVLIPLAFSHTFGEDGKYGGITYGPGLGWHSVSYGFESKPIRMLAEDGLSDNVLDAVQSENSFFSYGAFASLKTGWNPVFLVLGFSAWYQDYGDFAMLDGKKRSLAGATFVPWLGITFGK